MTPGLHDRFQRKIKKLRLSVTHDCNMGCFYCRTMEGQKSNEVPREVLSVFEIGRICQRLINLGMQEIRITGGEPTLRKDLMEIVARLGELPLKKLALTTNGLEIAPLLKELKRHHCHALNFSLDSLDAKTFQAITQSPTLDRVVNAIDQAIALDFQVKVNVVLLRGVNHHEIKNFVEFSRSRKVDVRFLELMKIGPADSLNQKYFISGQEILATLNTLYNSVVPITLPAEQADSTAKLYQVDGLARIGVIASETESFCHHCSRLRLNAYGDLRPCLLVDSGLNIAGINEEQEFLDRVHTVLEQRVAQRGRSSAHTMVKIGG